MSESREQVSPSHALSYATTAAVAVAASFPDIIIIHCMRLPVKPVSLPFSASLIPFPVFCSCLSLSSCGAVSAHVLPASLSATEAEQQHQPLPQFQLLLLLQQQLSCWQSSHLSPSSALAPEPCCARVEGWGETGRVKREREYDDDLCLSYERRVERSGEERKRGRHLQLQSAVCI